MRAVPHKYTFAYDRQGRHDSARRSSSDALLIPKVRCRLKSPDGNASGSPSARIAMYCVVHLPIPGIAHKFSRNRTVFGVPNQAGVPGETAPPVRGIPNKSRVFNDRAAGRPSLALFCQNLPHRRNDSLLPGFELSGWRFRVC
jgi:hypothetical protein